MQAQPTPAEPPSDPGQQAADAHYYRAVLHELIDMGADLARRLHRQATARPGPLPAPARRPNEAPNATPASPPADLTADVTLAFDRIARCVRRTVLLARKLAEPLPPPAGHDAARRRIAARKTVIRDVEDAIHRAGRGPAAERLAAELHNRLDAPDLDDDILHRPVADIVTEIIRDLGLAAAYGANLWKRRTPRDLEALRARAARPTLKIRRVGESPPTGTTSASPAPVAPPPSQRLANSPPAAKHPAPPVACTPPPSRPPPPRACAGSYPPH